MTDEQKMVIRCAFADLCGAMQAYLACKVNTHDWKAHLLTIHEMAQAFDFLDPVPDDLAN